MAREILICKTSSVVDVDGVPTPIFAGRTRVRAGHQIAREHPELFEPIGVDYEVDENTSSRTRDTGRPSARAAKKASADKPAAPAKTAPAKSAAPDPKPNDGPTKGLTTGSAEKV